MPRKRSPVGLPSVTALLLALSACATTARSLPTLAPEPEPGDLGEGPELVEEEVRAVEPTLLGEAAYDLPLEANTWVEAELQYLVEQRRAVIGRWIERGDYYEDYVKSVLLEHGLPTDLYHLAMIESGFIPSARSRAGALGMWQFMPATGRMEGLRVDALVDERLDPVRSTRAAARHLSSLHRQFNGDWALAAAAYNAGGGRISRGLQNFAVTNFWDLAVWGDLADETKHYVPRLYAMTIVTRDRARFGFAPRPELSRTFAFDSVLVDCATPLAELAKLGVTELDDLVRLNPHLLQRTTPAGGYWIWAPVGTGENLQIAYLVSEFHRHGGVRVYVVRRGDTLGKLAELSGVSQARIRELNPRVNWAKLQTGTRLNLPYGAAAALAARPQEAAPAAAPAARQAAPSRQASGSTGNGSARTAASNTRFVEHVVKPGETLWGISRRYGVGMDAIREANRLSGTTVVAGRTLRIPQQATTRTAQGGSSAPAKKEEVKLAEHVVKVGETLWSIAREYGATVPAIQSANRIDSDVIVPGQKLLIPR